MNKTTRFVHYFVRSFLVLSILLLFFALGFGVRGWMDQQFSGVPLLLQARDLLQKNYLNPLPAPSTLEYGMINGMVAAVGDPHTVFVEPPQHAIETNTLAGQYGGIGARSEQDTQGYIRLYPLPGSPALKAGIQDGDRLLKVDNLTVTPQTDPNQVLAAIRGPVGQKVTVVIGHSPDFTPVALTITRAEIPLPSITYNLIPEEPRVAILHISVIAATTPDELKAAVKDMTAKGASYFILDLRNNGGGLVDGGVDTARLFLKDGEVMEDQFKGQAVEIKRVEKPGELSDLPIVVLVNQNTASAAEIISGALQAHHRAKLIGANTYGKDSIQLVFDLQDGSSLHVTAAKWWVPGVTVPLKPDIVLADDPNDSNALVMAGVKALLQP